MAKPYMDMKMTMELSPKDRQLLRDVVDAIRSLKDEPETEGPTRLLEQIYGIPKVRHAGERPLEFDSKPPEQLLEGQYRDADGRLRREGGGW